MIPAVRRLVLRPSSSVNYVFDGHSIVAGVGTSNYAGDLNVPASKAFPNQLMTLPGFAGSGCGFTNLGISGQTWRQMDGSGSPSWAVSTDVDGAWQAGKTNVLVLLGTANDILPFQGGRSVTQTVADSRSYVLNRLAAHQWIIAIINQPPLYFTGQGDAANAQYNSDIISANQQIAAAAPSWGVRMVIEPRLPGGYMDMSSFTQADFARWSSMYGDTNGWMVHPGDMAALNLARIVGARLLQLPVK